MTSRSLLIAFLIPFALAKADAPCVIGARIEGLITQARVRELLDHPQIKSSPDPIDAMLCCLPSGFVQQAVYMHETGSAQEATKTKPRVILYSSSQNLILGFSGESNSVEMIEPRQSDADFSLKFFRYHPTRNGAGENNNKGCVECHNGHHLWNTYFLWPGAYGGNDEALDSSERKPFREFIRQKKSIPRYRCVGDENEESVRGLTDLGEKIFDLNVMRVAHLLRNDSKLKPFRAKLLGLGLCLSEGAGDWTPSSFLSDTGNVISQLSKALERDDARYTDARFAQLEATTVRSLEFKNLRNRSFYMPREAERIAAIRYVTKTLAGSDTMDSWSVVPDNSSLSFNDGSGRIFVEEVMKTLLPRWKKELGVKSAPDDLNKLCDELSKKSRETQIATPPKDTPKNFEKSH